MSCFDDRAVEAEVDAAITAGGRLPRWGWGIPQGYNGATGEERIIGWQKVQIARRMGLIGWPAICSVCKNRAAAHHHTEIYFRPLATKPICRPCHHRLHRRFQSPNKWVQYLQDCEVRAGWATAICSRELSRREALFLAEKRNPLDARQLFSPASTAAQDLER